MSKKAYIKKAIAIHIEENSLFYSDYSNWYVGITADPRTRHGAHGAPNLWRHWQAESHHEAREIERHFLDRGMNGGPGGGRYPRYIYVYKKWGPGS